MATPSFMSHFRQNATGTRVGFANSGGVVFVDEAAEEVAAA
jgi:hypothetical protein